MEKTSLAENETNGTDLELRAVRSLIAQEQGVLTAPAEGRRQSLPRAATPPPEAPAAGAKATAYPAQEASGVRSESFLVLQARRGALAAWAAICNYHPDRKSVLRTSLILLLMLKPFMIIGWTLFAIFAFVLLLLFVGSDAFWRKVIALYQAYARRKPAAARVLKLRAYVIARRWDSLLQWVPQDLADILRSPDLREIIAADARHDQAMSNRLNRLREDVAA